MYVLSAGGGLWKTPNFFINEPTWQALTDNLTSTNGGSFAFGSVPGTIYLGLGDPFNRAAAGGYMYKSTDGGLSWEEPLILSSPLGLAASFINQVRVDNSQPVDIVIVMTDCGIFRSTDAGKSYLFSYDSGNYGMEMYIAYTSIGWIGYDYGGFIYPGVFALKQFLSSSDHGATWSVQTSNWNSITDGLALRTTFSVAVDGDSVVYAQVAKMDGSQLNIFKSIDGGINWIDLKCNASYVPTNPNAGLALCLYSSFFEFLYYVYFNFQ